MRPGGPGDLSGLLGRLGLKGRATLKPSWRLERPLEGPWRSLEAPEEAPAPKTPEKFLSPVPVLVPRRTPPGTWPLVGATVPLAVGRQASDLDRPAPSMSRGISAATIEGRPMPEFRVWGLGV